MPANKKVYAKRSSRGPSEIEGLYRRIRNGKHFEKSPQRRDIFDYLWKNRDQPSKLLDIWEGAIEPSGSSAPEPPPGWELTTRVAVHDLRYVLIDLFVGVREGPKILLDPAKKGLYQLSIRTEKHDDDATWAFWRPHIKSKHGVAIVYVEQQFYTDWSKNLVFRYYDCNEDNRSLQVLKRRHLDIYKAHENQLIPSFPYVSGAEIKARDRIGRWFVNHASIEAQNVIPRHHTHDAALFESSLILLGSGESNEHIKTALAASPKLPMKMELGAQEGHEWFGRVVFTDPTKEEKTRLQNIPNLDFSFSETLGIVEFAPKNGMVLVLLTRIPSQKNGTTTTILNAEFGRAIEQLAILLTDEARMESGKELPTGLPEYFQALFAVPVDQLTPTNQVIHLERLVFRAYSTDKRSQDSTWE